jgi:hypothetical protein
MRSWSTRASKPINGCSGTRQVPSRKPGRMSELYGASEISDAAPAISPAADVGSRQHEELAQTDDLTRFEGDDCTSFDDDGGTLAAEEEGLPTRQEAWEQTWNDNPEYYDESDLATPHDGDTSSLATEEEGLPTRQEAWEQSWGDAVTQGDTAAIEATDSGGADSLSDGDASQESVVQDQDGDRPSVMDPAVDDNEAHEVPGRQQDSPVNSRPDITARYPADYVPSSDPPPDVKGSHEQPEGWVPSINPERGEPGRDNNCGECSRAVDNTWAGHPTTAAALADADAGGEPVARMTEWAGTSPTPANMTEIGQRLSELGPGSSAIVGCDWNSGGGHWFNAVNDGGTLKAVDGQHVRVEEWPPSMTGLRFDESRMRYSDAIFFSADGKVVKDDHT